MASDLTKVKLGPCKVIFDEGSTSEVTFETTQGGVTLSYQENSKEVNVDQYGSTPIKELITGRTASIDVPFAERENTKLAEVLPGSTLVVDATDPSKTRVEVDASKAIDLLNYAKKVKLVPLDSSATANDHVILYKAAPRANLNYSYSYDNELITNVQFKAYPDTANGSKLIAFGDETATA